MRLSLRGRPRPLFSLSLFFCLAKTRSMSPTTPPSFTTKRLVFRAPEPADCAEPDGFLYSLLNDEGVQHGLTAGSIRPYRKSDVEKFVADSIAASSVYSVFCLKGDDTSSVMDLEPVGWITLEKVKVPHRKAMFGLAVAPKHEGQGYAKEAMDWLLERAFDGYGLNKVEVSS